MTTYQHIFPTCIAADINTSFVEPLYRIGNEYLEEYGGVSPPWDNHITTYHNKESALKLSKDDRITPFFNYVKNESRNFLDAMNVNPMSYEFKHIFSFFAKVGATSKHDLHSHPGSVISGVYYLRVGETTPPIIFKDPRAYHKYIHYDIIFGRDSPSYSLFPEFVVTPKQGMLLLFPSWLEHEVPYSRAEEERMTFVFNLD